MTYEESIIQNWLNSGIDPDLIRLNPEAVDRQLEQELTDWIEIFISSFKESRLKSILRERTGFRRCQAIMWNAERSIAGISLSLKPDTEKDFKFVLCKHKQLAYRVRKLDPKVKLLSIFEPQGMEALTTVLPTTEVFFLRVGGAR